MTRARILMRAAAGLTRRGMAVFPVHSPSVSGCSCGRHDCSSPCKHPRVHWRTSASTDAGQVRDWWTRWPTANIGLVTGVKSGLIVLDVDPAHGGLDSLRDLVAEEGAVEAFARVRTGGGGMHFYLRHPGGRVRNRTGLRPGIDVRGDGGYVVAPPSVHASGRRYVWEARDGR